MTLNKAIQELFAELNRTDLSEEEKNALEKYKTWLCSIKGTVSNNTPYWHPYPKEKPTSEGFYLTTELYFQEIRLVNEYKYENGDFESGNVIAWTELPKPFDARVWV